MQKILCLLIFFIFVSKIEAQDVGFSQFYSNPVLLNPAMAGNTTCPTFILNYRRQTLLSNIFSTYALSADFKPKHSKSGFAVSLMDDNQGDGAINSFQAGADYSYTLKINHEVSLKAGLEGAVFQRKINYANLIFPDQLTAVSGVHNPTVENIGVENSALYFDFASGIVIFGKNYYLGFAAHHLTQPSHPDPNLGSKYVVLNRKFTLHAGMNFEFEKTVFDEGYLVSPAIIVEQQSSFQRISLGGYVERNSLIGGLWLKNDFKFSFASAIFMVGYAGDWFKIGYSYDFPLSEWGGATNLASAHELSLTLFPTCSAKSNSLKRAINCPEF